MDIAKLIEGLRQTDPGVRRAAVDQLESLGAEAGAAAWHFRRVVDKDDHHRIVQWIGELGPAAASATEFLLVLAMTWESRKHGDEDAIAAVEALEQTAGEAGAEKRPERDRPLA